ncbi:hypothetical protein REY75_23840 [Bacillus sp. MHSD_37]|uniref:hypothetical protein n=2 Tax=unclassified Bacillus (in: firmicutes) TaxID=185979 RepID=UPI0028531FE0|nr:hypothetical protein [Bacillus sp. MHSD_37]MDR4981562.1 hypothetical protein [Bacillus sp. MHSD_37]
MLKQLENKNIKNEDIWIWDNNSTAPALLAFYDQISTKYNLVKNIENYGPRFFAAPCFFDLLPDFFAVTDPDLAFNEKMPDNFLEYLKQLTIELSLFKAGLIIPSSDFMTVLANLINTTILTIYIVVFQTTPNVCNEKLSN